MIRWCVIGAGGIADRRFIPALLQSADCKLVAVMDRAADLAEGLGKKYNVPAFSDEEEMYRSVECDAVYIATPVFCHYAQAMAALSHGKHVFLEKPIALTAEESARLVQAFKDAGKQLSIGYMMNYHNLHQKAKELVQSGGIGKVVDIRAQFSCWYPDIEGAWRQKKALGGGGAFMDLGVHCVALIQEILGEDFAEIKSLCTTQTFHYEVEDSAIAIFRTQSGALGHIDVNFNVPDRAAQGKLELYGTKGTILCEGTLAQEEVGTLTFLYAPQGDYAAQQDERQAPKPQQYNGAGGNLYLKQINAFCKLLAAPDLSGAERAVRVQEIAEEVYKN